MPQTLKISTPLKGVNRAFGREAQPPNTCFDALNVLPFDRYGRMRLSERTGLGLLTTLDAALPVRLLHVASTINPDTGAGSSTLVTDPFTYANGNLGALAGWKTYVYSGGDRLTDGIEHTDGWKIVSNAITLNHATYGANNYGAVSQTAITLGTNYDYSIDFTLTSGTQSFNLNLYTHMTVATHDVEDCLFAQYSIGGTDEVWEIFSFTGGVPNTSSPTDYFTLVQPISLSLGATHTLTLRRRGTTVSIRVDGVEIGSCTPPSIPVTNGVAFSLLDDEPSGDYPTPMDNFIVTAPGEASVNRTTLKLVATSGTKTYVGDPTSMAAATATATYPIDSSALFLSAATLFGYTYIVDGTNIRRLRLSDDTMVPFTASAGSAPTGCTIACNWRGRLILSGTVSDPQNFFASKLGDPLNWDNSDTTPAASFDGNASLSGRVGQPIMALIPMSDDIMVIGCEQSMWSVRGDPADGGSLVQVTDFAGISSATAWTRAPDGSLYFVGPRGLFKMNPSATNVVEVSQTTYPQFFQAINRQTNFVSLMYDADRYGVWVFVCPVTQGATATSMFYHLPAEGMWPQNLAGQLNAGPLGAIWWDGYSSDTRYPVLGGFDGGLYAFNSTNRSDNGGAINAYVTLGPIRPSDVEATLIGTTFNLGELGTADLATPSRWNSNFSLYAGASAYDASEGTPRSTGVVTWGSQGRTKTLRQRLRGEWFAVKISNSATSNYFSLESVDLEFNTNGRNRRQGL